MNLLDKNFRVIENGFSSYNVEYRFKWFPFFWFDFHNLIGWNNFNTFTYHDAAIQAIKDYQTKKKLDDEYRTKKIVIWQDGVFLK